MLTNSTSLKTLGPQAAKLVTTLHEQSRSVFRLEDVRDITGLSETSARSFVRKLVDRGVAARLKPGLYVLVPFELGRECQYAGNPLVVAREIMHGEEYYLSHSTAMEIHGMTTQPQLVVIVSTPEPRRPVTTLGVEFRFVRCRRKHLFGLTEHWVTKQEKVCVSDLERTIIDGLKQPQHCGGLTEVAKGLWMRRQDVNADRLVEYAKRIGVGAVVRRLGFLLETYELAAPPDLDRLREGLTATYVRLDPVLPAEGKRLRRWRLQLNVEPEELRAVART
ncbi:type IV toxin-antitoxin system AbiEi family antitoxin [Methylacidimicrobium sp. B4]|uniref:type IV toxin-antitoxin system AbiEi family antitoxin domain-containing protein n=1 Tax=Methylacidimicrobium sp. B4 TaxID=2796139 RepID=UPI001A8D6ABC|nr:type IV toxin-antitoxin system AbiEi family antitoxin [Methylacidimicrobium sp. B4]QSR84801.1 type IV toxin-antitoxin system AbiEi family antitoxin domain-containing protein [Methylacidimicrobium sp. B4]